MAQFESLPDDVIIDMLEYLEHDNDIFSLSLTATRFHHLIHPYLYSLHVRRQRVGAFVWAVKHDRADTMRMLLDAGGSVLVREIGWLAAPLIILTAACGSVAVMKLILETEGADTNLAPEGNYSTAVTSAVECDKPEILKLLLAQPALNPDICGVHRTPALSRAAFLGRKECVRLLLQDHRVDPMIEDKKEVTPLMWAVKTSEDNEDVIKLLVADPRVKLDALDEEGLCAMRWAGRSGNVKNIQVLLDAGAAPA